MTVVHGDSINWSKNWQKFSEEIKTSSQNYQIGWFDSVVLVHFYFFLQPTSTLSPAHSHFFPSVHFHGLNISIRNDPNIGVRDKSPQLRWEVRMPSKPGGVKGSNPTEIVIETAKSPNSIVMPVGIASENKGDKVWRGIFGGEWERERI